MSVIAVKMIRPGKSGGSFCAKVGAFCVSKYERKICAGIQKLEKRFKLSAKYVIVKLEQQNIVIYLIKWEI